MRNILLFVILTGCLGGCATYRTAVHMEAFCPAGGEERPNQVYDRGWRPRFMVATENNCALVLFERLEREEDQTGHAAGISSRIEGL